MNTRALLGIAAAALICSLPISTAALAQEAAQSSEESAEQEDFADFKKVVVTGTRLRVGDPTANVDVVTAEMIAERGLTTVEDVIRDIPQNFSSLNSGTNLRDDAVFDNVELVYCPINKLYNREPLH